LHDIFLVVCTKIIVCFSSQLLTWTTSGFSTSPVNLLKADCRFVLRHLIFSFKIETHTKGVVEMQKMQEGVIFFSKTTPLSV